jgi:hypothetical protein
MRRKKTPSPTAGWTNDVMGVIVICSRGIWSNEMTARLLTTRNLIVLVLAVAFATLALILILRLDRSPGPSPFFTGAENRNDPIKEVFERVIARLARTHSDVEVLGDESSSGTDSKETYVERTKTISCSRDAAEEMAAELQIWCEFAATRAGARVQRGHHEYGEKQTVFSFRYEYPHIKGIVKVTMQAPEKSAEDLRKRQSSGGSLDLEPYLYKLHWEVRESPSS